MSAHRSIFGWDLPPGCTMRDIDEQAGLYDICPCCDMDIDTNEETCGEQLAD